MNHKVEPWLDWISLRRWGDDVFEIMMRQHLTGSLHSSWRIFRTKACHHLECSVKRNSKNKINTWIICQEENSCILCTDVIQFVEGADDWWWWVQIGRKLLYYVNGWVKSSQERQTIRMQGYRILPSHIANESCTFGIDTSTRGNWGRVNNTRQVQTDLKSNHMPPISYPSQWDHRQIIVPSSRWKPWQV